MQDQSVEFMIRPLYSRSVRLIHDPSRQDSLHGQGKCQEAIQDQQSNGGTGDASNGAGRALCG